MFRTSREDRIPPSVRVWFCPAAGAGVARGLGRNEFFSNLDHPARKLIDRMGPVCWFDATSINGSALEAEIRRVVQVIEQYPDGTPRLPAGL